jgi:hypothetical protein
VELSSRWPRKQSNATHQTRPHRTPRAGHPHILPPTVLWPARAAKRTPHASTAPLSVGAGHGPLGATERESPPPPPDLACAGRTSLACASVVCAVRQPHVVPLSRRRRAQQHMQSASASTCRCAADPRCICTGIFHRGDGAYACRSFPRREFSQIPTERIPLHFLSGGGAVGGAAVSAARAAAWFRRSESNDDRHESRPRTNTRISQCMHGTSFGQCS